MAGYTSFVGQNNEIILICLSCAGHCPTGQTVDGPREFYEEVWQRHRCLPEPSPQGLWNLEELGLISVVADIMGVPRI